MAFVRVASLDEVPEGEVLGVEAEGKRVCLANVEDTIYAFTDNCSHREFPLSQGELDSDDCTITCEWHGATFDIRTGAARSLPATQPIAIYAVKVEEDEVWVDVDG
ncbi:bifunctional 3-phenylpropionate/cinnamic acid dioxygenase ferredoxin subunit [soil metagenome]|jgi:3-phenylpropionate/trans-cinnamate dioxygenase ferredoxin subunit